MPDLDELIRRLEDIESLLVRSKAAPQPRIDMPALLEEVRTAVAAGQHRTDSRLDEVWLAVAELSERLGVEPPAFPSAPTETEGDAETVEATETGGAGVGARPGTELAHRLVTLQDAVAELTRVMPRTSGPAAGVPGYLAESLNKIDQRLIAVERMGREQFELDQRLSAIEQTLATLIRPFEELSPRLRHVGEIVDWLGRIEERLHAVSIQLAPFVLGDEGRRQPPAALPPGAGAGTDAGSGAAQLVQLLAQLEARLAGEQPGRVDVGVVLDKLAAIEARLVEPLPNRDGRDAPAPTENHPDQHLLAVEDAVARVEAQLAAVAAQLRATPVPFIPSPAPTPVTMRATPAGDGATVAEPTSERVVGGQRPSLPRSRRRGPGRRSGAGRARQLRAAARRRIGVETAGVSGPSAGGAPEAGTDPASSDASGARAAIARPAGTAPRERVVEPEAWNRRPADGMQPHGPPQDDLPPASTQPDGERRDGPTGVTSALDTLAKRLDFLAVQVAAEQERSREADLGTDAALIELLQQLDDLAAASGKGRRGEESLDQRLRRLGDEMRGALVTEAAALRDHILEGVAEEGQASRATTANTAAALAALAHETAGSKMGIERMADVADRQHGTVAALVESLALRDERVSTVMAMLHAQLKDGQLPDALAQDLAELRHALTDAATRAEAADDALELIRGSLGDLAAQTAAAAGTTDGLAVATRTRHEAQLAALRDTTATIADLRSVLESSLGRLQTTVEGGNERLQATVSTELASRIDALALNIGGRLDAWRVTQLAAEQAESDRAHAAVESVVARHAATAREEVEALAARLEAAQAAAADAAALERAALAELVAAARAEQTDLLRAMAERGALVEHLDSAHQNQSELIRQESAALAARLDAVLAAQAELARNEATALAARLEAAHAGQGELTRAEGAALAARLDAVHAEQAELARQQQGAVAAQLERTGQALVARLAETAERRDDQSAALLEAAAGALAQRVDDLARAQAEALSGLQARTDGAADDAAATREELVAWRAALDAHLDQVARADTATASRLVDAIEALGERLDATTHARLAELTGTINQALHDEVAELASLRSTIDRLGQTVDSATIAQPGELASEVQAVQREVAQLAEQLRSSARTQATEAGHFADAVQHGIEGLRVELERMAARAASDDEASTGERRELTATLAALGKHLAALTAGQDRSGETLTAAIEALNGLASLQHDLGRIEAGMQRPIEALSADIDGLPDLLAARIETTLADVAERLDPGSESRAQEAAFDRLHAEVARIGELVTGQPADGVAERLDRLAANVHTLRDALVNNEMVSEVGRLATAVLGMERDLGLARQRLTDVDRALEAMGGRDDLATEVASLSERLDLGLADLTRTVATLARTVDDLNRHPARSKPS